MNRIFYLPSFVRQLQKLKGGEAQAAEEALISLDHFVRTGDKSTGLGFKKLASDKFEIRVDLKKRIVMKKIEEDYYLALYGNHDEIERFLKSFK